MTWIAVAIVGGSVVGGLISSDASRHAANTQADAAKQAQDTQLQMFYQNKADLAPFMQGGQQGFNSLLGYLGVGPNGFDPNAPGVRPFGMQDFQQDPSYQWRLQQGTNALLNARSAIGGLNSGATLKALTNYAQGAASQEYANAYNRYNQNQLNAYTRLAGLANTGVNAAGGIANLGANAANNVSGLQYAQGQAYAGGILGQANAANNAISNIGSNYLLANALQNGQNGMRTPYSGYGYDPWTTAPPYSGYGPM